MSKKSVQQRSSLQKGSSRNNKVSRAPIKYKDFLLDKKIRPDENVRNAISNAKKIITTLPLYKLMMLNPYEKMVPYNLWFKNSQYKIFNYSENGQNMRIRYIGSSMLTPLVSNDNTNLKQIELFLGNMSLYQPFYPETFYAMWEFLSQFFQINNADIRMKNFLHIGNEDKMGSLEAIVLYYEKYQHTYQYNTYHTWLSGKEMYNKTDGSYRMMVPPINYLDQAYKIKFIQSSKQLVKYNFISIDCNHLFSDILSWPDEEMDLHANLFYLFKAIEHLDADGSILIKLNMIGCKSWEILFDVIQKYFREYEFIRPSTSNPLNPELYLFVTSFDSKNSTNYSTNNLLKNLYRQKVYQFFHLSLATSKSNAITQKYYTSVNAWIVSLNGALKNPDKKFSNEIIDEWHSSNDLLQIKNLSCNFDDTSVRKVLKTSLKRMPVIKPILPNILYKTSSYKKLICKRADLNFCKRVMDTKPSRIFSDRRTYKPAYLLTWEELSNELDIYKNLKFILKSQYQAEMVTNAWIKMYEMLNSYHDLLPEKETIKTFSLCEAPGAFISALHQHVSKRGNINLDWYAQTLRKTNCGKESDDALDDHFGLIATYPNRWLFGDENDSSGDITHSTVIKSYAKNPLLKDIDFITSDAGLVCDPADLNEQEAFLGKINMGQIICILACLPVGKSAIFKTFLPMSEPLTISMMYLVTQLFNSVTLEKPSSSHSSNSEIYVVVKDYKGIDTKMLDILYDMLDEPKITSKTLLFSEIDKQFFESYMDNINFFISRQIQSLCRNYYYYYHLNEVDKFKEISEKQTEYWLRMNQLFILKNKLIGAQGNNLPAVI